MKKYIKYKRSQIFNVDETDFNDSLSWLESRLYGKIDTKYYYKETVMLAYLH